MITGGKITSVEAKREKEGQIKGLNINIGLDSVKVKSDEIEIGYTYTATYADGIGTLKIVGTLNAKEDKKKAKEIEERWEKEKRLPDQFAEVVLNSINFTCGTNGTFVVRPVNLSPPMIPPKISVARGGGKTTAPAS
jgi:hypothetical protein